MEYTQEKKLILDTIVERNKVDIVGYGYIDLIVQRSNYKNLITELVQENFIIQAIAWWEWCKSDDNSRYGMGGPHSRYHNGWYAEMPIPMDNLEFVYAMEHINKQKFIADVLLQIETKQIKFHTEIITFDNSPWLTPALWLDVPDNWKNNQIK